MLQIWLIIYQKVGSKGALEWKRRFKIVARKIVE